MRFSINPLSKPIQAAKSQNLKNAALNALALPVSVLLVLLATTCCAFTTSSSSSGRIFNNAQRPTTTCRYAYFPHVDPRLVARSVRPSVAMVVPVGVRNSTARGSGFVVDFPPTSTNTGANNANGVGNDDAGRRRQDAIYLLTAAHVAAPGYRIEVLFSNSTDSVAASVVGRNSRADLALLKVEVVPAAEDNIINDDISEHHLPLQLSSDEVEVGNPSFAIGYPSGGIIGSAITSGIVCASARGLSTPLPQSGRGNNTNTNDESDQDVVVEAKTRFIVTDAAMAGGMSGGPLVDENGVVIGVNALINMELRALGNYAVDASECRAFLSDLAERVDESARRSTAGDATESSDVESISYGVILYNDRFNKRERVSKILKEIAEVESKEAEKIMMEAHRLGSSVIQVYDENSKDEARKLCESLRSEDILVEVQQMEKESSKHL